MTCYCEEPTSGTLRLIFNMQKMKITTQLNHHIHLMWKTMKHLLQITWNNINNKNVVKRRYFKFQFHFEKKLRIGYVSSGNGNLSVNPTYYWKCRQMELQSHLELMNSIRWWLDRKTDSRLIISLFCTCEHFKSVTVIPVLKNKESEDMSDANLLPSNDTASFKLP